MHRNLALIVSILLVGTVDLAAQRSERPVAVNAVQSLGDLAVAFVPNRGQVADTRGDRRSDILYTASSRNTQVFIRANAISYVFQRRIDPDSIRSDHARHAADHEANDVEYYRMDIELVGAREYVDVVEEQVGHGVRHYYLAHCPDGVLGVPSFGRITLKSVYPMIDMVLRGSEQGMKCEFIVHPGGRPSDIVMKYVAASKVTLTDDGGVSASTPLGELYESAPVSFQDAHGSHREIASAFHLDGDRVSFDVGEFDRGQVLVIDPIRRWATYYGGQNNEVLVGGDPTEVDRDGNVIVAGYANANTFPATTGAHQATSGGSDDAFVLKLNGNGALQWATYYGGSSGEMAHGVVCDTSLNVFIAGHTTSNNFPTQNPAQSTFGGNRDAFVVKFSRLGVRQWATFYGGGQFDDGYGFAADSAGNVAVLITAVSAGLQTTGMVPIATHPPTANGVEDILIAKFSSSGSLLWATYFGGNDTDYAYAVATDTSEAIVITGWTYSTNLPLTNAAQSTYGGNGDIVVARFDKDGLRIWSTYYGGSGIDNDDPASTGYVGIATDLAGNVLVGGITTNRTGGGSQFPVTTGAAQTLFGGGGRDAYVLKLNALGALQWATFVGGNSDDVGSGVAARPDGSILLTGFTTSTNLPVTANCVACTPRGMRDVMIARLSRDGAFEFVDYYGGSNIDEGHGISFDPFGSMIVGGVTYSTNFPIANPAQPLKGGGSTNNADAFVVLFCDPAKPNIDSSGPLRLCRGDSVVLEGIDGFTEYRWNDITRNTTRTLVVRDSGDYVLWAKGANGCDAYSDTVKVRLFNHFKSRLTPAGPIKLCLPDSVMLDAGSGYATYEWMPNGEATRLLNVRASGSYRAMTMDANGCRDTSDAVVVTAFQKPITPTISPTGPISICEGSNLLLEAAGSPADSYRWSNNQTGQTMTPRTTGVYRVTVTGQGGCTNVSEDVVVTVVPNPLPVIYPVGPTTICEGDSVVLSPTGGFARYRWSTGATTRNIAATTTGDYQVAVTDSNGCVGTTQIHVTVIERPTPRVTVMGPRIFCERDSVLLDAGGYYASYQWSTGETSQTIAARQSGDYWVRVTDGTECPGTSDTVAIVVKPAPLAGLTGPVVVCQNTMQSYSVIADARHKITWTVVGPNASIASGAGTPTINVNWGSIGSGSVRVVIEDQATGCKTDTTLYVEISTTLVPSISGRTTICTDDTTVLDAGPGYATYAWSTGETDRSITVRGAGTYRVFVTSASGCTGSGEVVVTVAPTPNPIIRSTHAPALCPGESMTLAVAGQYADYVWSNGDRGPTLTISQPGTYTVIVTDASGCRGESQAFVVGAQPVPRPTIDGPSVVCPSARNTYTASGAAADSYTWSVIGGGGTIVSGDGTQSIVVQWGAGGTARIDVSTTVATTGCSGNGEPLGVMITDDLAPVITPDGSTDLCYGDTLTLEAPAGYMSYTWSNGATSQSIAVSTAGTYRVTVTGAGGCSGDGEITVTTRARIEPAIQLLGPQEFCDGDSTIIEGPAGFASYVWSTGDSTRSIIATESGTYSLTVIDDYGCIGTSTAIRITKNPLPAQPTITIIGGELESSPAATYQWYADGAIIPGAIAQRHRPTSMAAHTVRVTNQFGCFAFSLPFDGAGASAVISMPVISASPGDRILIPVLLASSSYLDAVGADAFVGTVRFNRLLLFPTGTTPLGRVEGDERIVPYAGTRSKGMGDGVLTTLEFIVALGDTNCTVLQLDSLVWLDAPVSTNLESGLLTVTTSGGWLAYLPGGRLAISDPTPNPAIGRISFAIETIEPGLIDLALYDVLGKRALEIIHKELPAGQYPVELESNGIAAGTYFIVLVTPTGRVVRSIQVAH